MRARLIPPKPPKGTLSECAAAYGLTVEEYRWHWIEFVNSEGWHDDGHFSKTFHDWLLYDPYQLFEPFHKGDEWE